MNRLRKFAFPLLIPLLLVAACGGQGASQPEEASRLEVLERAAVVASRGGATTLEVANWNVEWFRSSSYVPTNGCTAVPIGDSFARVVWTGVTPLGAALL